MYNKQINLKHKEIANSPKVIINMRYLTNRTWLKLSTGVRTESNAKTLMVSTHIISKGIASQSREKMFLHFTFWELEMDLRHNSLYKFFLKT